MFKQNKLLIIDDEPAVRRFLNMQMVSQSFVVEEAETGQDGLAKTAEFKPDVIILDLGLPDCDGLEVLKNIREWSKVPVIVLTVRDSENDKVSLLEAGADDYLTKPFSVAELNARVKVALRHYANRANEATPVLRNGPLEIDFGAHIVKMNGQQVKLTVTEYNILRLLALEMGKVIPQQKILSEIWGLQGSDNIHYVRIYVGQLRKKLESDPSHPKLVLTEPGVGYRLNYELN